MRAAVYDQFCKPLEVRDVADPDVPDDGIVLEVRATGLCRSDWHGWMGHLPEIELPHVPGHEMSGVIAETGPAVRNFKAGDRVTLPFVCGCGQCGQCRSGNQQVCDAQFQPGFSHWGCYAQFVAIQHADLNLVRLPDALDFAAAASLGCRFATAWRAAVDQGRLAAGEWVAVHGCGGVGLAAIMIANALEARVIAVDISPAALELAARAGAELCLESGVDQNVVADIREHTGGGANLSVDAFGSVDTFRQSVYCLAKRGRHVQVGLMTGDDQRAPLRADILIARELELIGSHGMQAHRYPGMLDLVMSGRIDLGLLRGRSVTLAEAAVLLAQEKPDMPAGITVIEQFA